MREREDTNLVPSPVQVLNSRVVGVLVGSEESSSNLTSIRIGPLTVEYILVQVDVIYVNGPVEGDGDHLGYVGWF